MEKTHFCRPCPLCAQDSFILDSFRSGMSFNEVKAAFSRHYMCSENTWNRALRRLSGALRLRQDEWLHAHLGLDFDEIMNSFMKEFNCSKNAFTRALHRNDLRRNTGLNESPKIT